MNFILSGQAESAIERMWDYYYEQGGTALADRILAELHDTIHLLVANPGFGHARPDLTDKPFRFYRLYRIFIIYDPASTPLYIARIYHSAQDIQSRMQSESDS